MQVMLKSLNSIKRLKKKNSVDVGFRMRQCNVAEIPQAVTSFDWRLGVRSALKKHQHILIAFQTDRNGKQEKNPSLFDHVEVLQINFMLNDTRF